MDGPRKMSECEGGGHERRVESEHVPDQEARGIFSFAGLSSHGMNPCNHFISCLVFLSLVSKLALRLVVVTLINVE